MLAPIAWRTPPRHYGPWEQFASLLTEGLVAAGHHVTLFATADSITTASLHSTAACGWSEDESIDAKVVECLHIASVFERADEFDVIHNGFDFLPLTYSDLVEHTGGDHDPRFLLEQDRSGLPALQRRRCLRVDQRRGPTSGPALRRHHSPRHRCRRGSRSIRILASICCSSAGSIRTRALPRRSRSPAACGRRLDIAGIIQDQEYFRDAVEPFIDGDHVRYLGAVDAARRVEVLGSRTPCCT